MNKLIDKLRFSFKAFAYTFLLVFAVHITWAMIHSYVAWEFLVVSYLDFGSMTELKRGLFLIPYLLFPLGVASVRLFEGVPHFRINNKVDNSDDDADSTEQSDADASDTE